MSVMRRESAGIGAGVAMDDTGSLSKTLATVPLFKALSPSELNGVAAKMRQQSFPTGTTIFEQGGADTAFYVILSGEAEVTSKGPAILAAGNPCMLVKPTRIGDKTYPGKTTGFIDKFDPTRSFPYNLRVSADSYRYEWLSKCPLEFFGN